MMNFRTVKNNIVNNILKPNETAGSYKTLGYKAQILGAEEFSKPHSIVQVRYSSGNFNSVQAGATDHTAMYEIELIVAAASTADLTVIDNPASTDLQRAAAITALTDAAEVADNTIDELIDFIYQLLMDSRNRYLLTDNISVSRYIESIDKSDPMPRGSLVVMSALMKMPVNLIEDVLGIELNSVPLPTDPNPLPNELGNGIIVTDGITEDPAPAGVYIST